MVGCLTTSGVTDSFIEELIFQNDPVHITTAFKMNRIGSKLIVRRTDRMKCRNCGTEPRHKKEFEKRLGLCTMCYRLDRKIGNDFKRILANK